MLITGFKTGQKKVQFTKLLTNEDFPEVSRGHPNVIVIALPSCVSRSNQKVIRSFLKSGVIVQPILIPQVAPFANVIGAIISPTTAHSS